MNDEAMESLYQKGHLGLPNLTKSLLYLGEQGT